MDSKQTKKTRAIDPSTITVSVCVCEACGRVGQYRETDEGYSPCCNQPVDGARMTQAEANARSWN
jgi:hypothetical protein